MIRRLSVLDLSPISAGSGSARALLHSIDLAIFVERWRFTRHWLAEHHNTASVASTAPEIMIGQLARETRRLRIGSGGVMLPNHAPLKVAENFKMLEALFPGRIDLGLGRAPGTDRPATLALRRSDRHGGGDFDRQIEELLHFARGTFPEDHPFRTVRATPSDAPLPPLWILGSSPYSAELAASLGVGYAFAHHLNPEGTVQAMNLYRSRFVPSESFPEPAMIVALSALCAESGEEAEYLASSMELAFIRMHQGMHIPLPSPEEARAHSYTETERDMARHFRSLHWFGDPDSLRERMERLAEESGTEEIMILTFAYRHEDRLRSYELLAREWLA